ncbi:hypothetical protein GE09DRAFT_1243407 [Coniochaeta sp. 2T2.1]|nr:hypothetical protein GE09DRAFT_1243407 [Coniochaeta sp. 2T2.1]
MSRTPPWGCGPQWSDAALRVVFDDEGDLQLKVGRRKITLVVCSKSLARTSPVFKKMLFGGLAESKPAGDVEWVVELPEDDINGMHLLMHIVHGNLEKVPKKMSDSLRFCNAPEDVSTVLRGITCTADKYDMVRLLHPWADAWLDEGCRVFHGSYKARPHLANGVFWGLNYVTWRLDNIWCGWILGDEDLLQEELKHIISSTYYESNVAHTEPTGSSVVSVTESKLIHGRNRRMVLAVLYSKARWGRQCKSQTLPVRMQTYYDFSTQSLYDQVLTQFPQHHINNGGKQVLLRDLVTEQFLDAGIEIKALVELSLYKRSVYHLQATLARLEGKWRTDYLPYNRLESCGVFQASKAAVDNYPFFSLTGSQIKHLRAQRQKSGIREGWLEALKAEEEENQAMSAPSGEERDNECYSDEEFY